jgi:GST-like protein
MGSMRLYASDGTGSALAEIALEWAGVPYERESMSWERVSARSHPALLAANPLHQVPTLILPNGRVLSESAAIVLWLDELHPEAALLPPRASDERVHALRWLLFLVTTLYPTFTYGDFPARYVGGEEPQRDLVASTRAKRKEYWKQLEAEAGTPWFCGTRPSMLDAYIAVMSCWHPQRSWFTHNTPRLAAIAQAAAQLDQIRPTIARNFPAPV